MSIFGLLGCLLDLKCGNKVKMTLRTVENFEHFVACRRRTEESSSSSSSSSSSCTMMVEVCV
eukprot:2508164-Prymnesium_polylepis.1